LEATKEAAIKVVLADDHRIMREGLVRLLHMSSDVWVVGQAEDGFSLLAQLRKTPCHIVLMDLSMPGLSGVELLRRVKQEWPDVRVVVLTMHDEDAYAVRAFRSGADGYLTKHAASDALVDALRRVRSRGIYVSPKIAERLAMGLRGDVDENPHDKLSNREFEVFRQIVEGRRMTEVAERMSLSIKTVSTHKARILEKLAVSGTADLVRYALSRQIFADEAVDPLQANTIEGRLESDWA
jgi:DNA-binding NarL/FixJ family response regulator